MQVPQAEPDGSGSGTNPEDALGLATHEEILTDFPELSADDLHEALEYGAAAVSERELPYRETA